MSNRSIYKTCFVPLCKSTSIKTPNKKFFNVPTDEKLRKIWFKNAFCSDKPGKWKYFCCEDHFNFKDDLDNYIRYCLMGAPIKLKQNAVPHIFKCQPHRINITNDLDRSAYKKLNRKRDIVEIYADTENQSNNCLPKNKINNVLPPEDNFCTMRNKQKLEFACEGVISAAHDQLTSITAGYSQESRNSALRDLCPIVFSKGRENIHPSVSNSINNSNITLQESAYIGDEQFIRTAVVKKEVIISDSSEQMQNLEANDMNFTSNTSHMERICTFGTESSIDLFSRQSRSNTNTRRSFGVQVQQKLTKPHFRSKFVLCKPSTSDAYSQSTVQVVDRTCSPIKSLLNIPAVRKSNVGNSSKTTTSSSNNIEYQPLSSQTEYEASSTCSDEKKEKNRIMSEAALNMIRYFISMDATKYIGIRCEWLWIIDILHTSTKCSTDDINLTLMKIRTNDSFSRLGDQFGMSISQASRVFNKTVKPLSHYLKTLIYYPDIEKIKKNLPIAFRAYYSRVCSILDAFEIEIEKPSDSVKQALTWSDYKKCDTLKYLIICTPDGFITFISPGYGGRITDTLLFEESNAIDVLPEKTGVMADRGFKHIQTILNQKECELIRPPSVSSTGKSRKEDVLKTKSIASLRIHVERVIRRVREYKILEPHSCLDRNIMSSIDDIVVIVAELINLQKPIIKQ